LIRLTETGVAIARAQPREEAEPGRGSVLTVTAKGEIRLLLPTPLRVWSLSAFADLVELGAESRYRVTERSVARALRAGFEIRHIESFLANQAGVPVPAELSERLQGWSTEVRRVRMARLIRLTPDDPAQIADLTALLVDAGIDAVRVDQEIYVPIEDRDDLSPREAQLLTRLREAGFTPQGLATPRPAPRPRPPEPRHRDGSDPRRRS
jgi:hypothetical protein